MSWQWTWKRASTLMAALFLMAAAQSLWATELTIAPTLDINYWNDVKDAGLFGGGANNSSSGPGMSSGVDASGNLKRGMIQFNIGAIPTGATIESVTMTLFLGQVAGSGGGISGKPPVTISLYDMLSPWNSSTNGSSGKTGFGGTGQGFTAHANDATWNYQYYNTTTWTNGGHHAASASAATVVGNTVNSGYTWSSAGMVADVQAWLDGSTPNYGWELINTSWDADDPNNALGTVDCFTSPSGACQNFRMFYTKEGASPSDMNLPQYSPQLLVQYSVPEPGTLALLGTGLLGVFGIVRRRFTR